MDNTNYTIKSLPADDRPQEKLLKYGAGALSNSELIAVILRTGTREENVVMLSQRMQKEVWKSLNPTRESVTLRLQSLWLLQK